MTDCAQGPIVVCVRHRVSNTTASVPLPHAIERDRPTSSHERAGCRCCRDRAYRTAAVSGLRCAPVQCPVARFVLLETGGSVRNVPVPPSVESLKLAEV